MYILFSLVHWLDKRFSVGKILVGPKNNDNNNNVTLKHFSRNSGPRFYVMILALSNKQIETIRKHSKALRQRAVNVNNFFL